MVVYSVNAGRMGMSRTMKKYYTVYLRESDELIVYGTASECAKVMGKTLNCFHSMVSKTKKGKQNKYDILVEELNASGETTTPEFP